MQIASSRKHQADSIQQAVSSREHPAASIQQELFLGAVSNPHGHNINVSHLQFRFVLNTQVSFSDKRQCDLANMVSFQGTHASFSTKINMAFMVGIVLDSF